MLKNVNEFLEQNVTMTIAWTDHFFQKGRVNVVLTAFVKFVAPVALNMRAYSLLLYQKRLYYVRVKYEYINDYGSVVATTLHENRELVKSLP